MVLIWNETDFLEYLEVEPTLEDEYDYCYSYVKKCTQSLRLELTIYPYSGDIYISLFHESLEWSIFDIVMRDCPGARVVNDKRGNYIEFAESNCFTNRYDGESVIPYGVRLFVKPQIHIELFAA